MIAFPARTAGAAAAALLTLACRGPGPSADQLAERLRSLDQRAEQFLVLDMRGPVIAEHLYRAPDAHGTVVAVDGERLAVRLDDDVPFPRYAVCMAILAAGTREGEPVEREAYKGELLVREVWRGHALGRFIAVVKQPVRIGDRASCRMP